MKTNDTTQSSNPQPTGVQHDSQEPFTKKPSVLYVLSTSIGVLVIILLTAVGYFGITR
jgi:hypothetical protein